MKTSVLVFIKAIRKQKNDKNIILEIKADFDRMESEPYFRQNIYSQIYNKYCGDSESEIRDIAIEKFMKKEDYEKRLS